MNFAEAMREFKAKAASWEHELTQEQLERAFSNRLCECGESIENVGTCARAKAGKICIFDFQSIARDLIDIRDAAK